MDVDVNGEVQVVEISKKVSCFIYFSHSSTVVASLVVYDVLLHIRKHQSELEMTNWTASMNVISNGAWVMALLGPYPVYPGEPEWEMSRPYGCKQIVFMAQGAPRFLHVYLVQS